MSKYFFQTEDDDLCYPLSHFKDVLADTGESEMVLFEAVMEKDTEHFFCSFFGEVGIKGEGACGKECEKYSPRNGKNGRCKHSKNCYTTNGKTFILKSKP